MTIEVINRERFAKVWKLAKESPNAGERAAAMARADAMLATAGLTLADVPSFLAAPEQQPRNIFEGFEDWMEAREPAYKARAAAAAAKRARERDDFRRSVIG